MYDKAPQVLPGADSFFIENPVRGKKITNLKISNPRIASAKAEYLNFVSDGQKCCKLVPVRIKPLAGWKLTGLMYNEKIIRNGQKIRLNPKAAFNTGSRIDAKFQNIKTKQVLILSWGYTNWTYMKTGNGYPLYFYDPF